MQKKAITSEAAERLKQLVENSKACRQSPLEIRSVLPETHKRMITSAAVRHLSGGISDMTIWRWLHDPNLGFPKPHYIRGRRYWAEAEILAWLESRSGKAA